MCVCNVINCLYTKFMCVSSTISFMYIFVDYGIKTTPTIKATLL